MEGKARRHYKLGCDFGGEMSKSFCCCKKWGQTLDWTTNCVYFWLSLILRLTLQMARKVRLPALHIVCSLITEESRKYPTSIYTHFSGNYSHG